MTTLARSSNVIFSGSLSLGAIVPLCVRALGAIGNFPVRRPGLSSAILRTRRVQQRLSGLWVHRDRHDHHARKHIPRQQRSQKKNCQVRERRAYSPSQRRHFLLPLRLVAGSALVEIFSILALQPRWFSLPRFSGGLPASMVHHRKVRQALDPPALPPEAAFLVRVRIVNPRHLLRRRKEILVNERVVVRKKHAKARMRVIPPYNPLIRILRILDFVDVLPGVLRKRDMRAALRR